jgi:hypothetical protein
MRNEAPISSPVRVCEGVFRRGFCRALLAMCLVLAPAVFAQDEEPPQKKGVRIAFIPPPMEGTWSLGIYDKKGKLVRVLAREATEKNFTVGLNGLITFWDGRDDSGKALPSGMYSASGYAVGALDVEGIAYHGNDWMIADDSPRVRRVLSLELRKGGRLALWAETPNGKLQLIQMAQAGEFAGEIPADPRVGAQPTAGGAPASPDTEPPPSRAAIDTGKVVVLDKGEKRVLALPNVANPTDASLGREGRVWVIDQTPERTEVKEFGLDGEFHRRLAIDPAEPVPTRIFASRTSDLIFLIEEKPGLQRVRGLALESPAASDPAAPTESPTSTWKTILSKTILASDAFAAINGQLQRQKPFSPEEKFTVRLLPNPLLKGESTSVQVNVSFDNTGSYLQTLDGLPLRRITETPNLKWVVIGKEGSGRLLSIFQGDGAVVEEFRARQLANMMAFDAGDYEWTGK